MTATTDRYIELDQATHRYFVDGEEQLGVTRILQLCGFIDDRWYTEYGRWRGSAVHRATHYFDEGDIDRRTLDPVIKPFVADWKAFREATRFMPVEIEQPVFEPTYGYCGTPDRIGFFALSDLAKFFSWEKVKGLLGKTEPAAEPNVIVDIKAYPGGQVPWWVRYQLAGYGRARDPKRVFHRFAVVLTGETHKVKDYPLDEYVEDVNDFLSCVRVARIRLRNQEG